jgi:hypothetical protein
MISRGTLDCSREVVFKNKWQQLTRFIELFLKMYLRPGKVNSILGLLHLERQNLKLDLLKVSALHLNLKGMFFSFSYLNSKKGMDFFLTEEKL